MRILPFLIVAVSLLGIPNRGSAEVVGKTYSIIEPDMLQEIYRTLEAKRRTGELARLEREAIQRSIRSADTPRPVQAVTRTVTPRRFYFDPSYTAPRTLADPEGRVVVVAGTKVNPLDYVSLSKHMLFFDGRDRAQVQQIARLISLYEGRVKPILVGGSISELSRKWKRQVYFDQGGALTTKLGIRQVPAVVSQEGRLLRVDELYVEESGQ